MSGPRHAGLLLALALLAWPAGAARAPEVPTGRQIVFVYVESNVGGASGGHTALRFDDEVYHFQQHPDAIFRLRRETWGEFRSRYGTIQNRPIHVATLPVAEPAARRARDRFREHHLTQTRDLDAFEARRRDRQVLLALAGKREGIGVPGAGFFDPARAGDEAAVALRERLRAGLPPGFLSSARSEALAAGRRRLRFAPDRAPRGLTQARADLALHTALSAIEEAWPLLADALADPAPDVGLDAGERRTLERLARRLETTLLELLEQSARPDRGEVLLLTLARRLALERALRSGRLLFLDPHPDGPPLLDASDVRRRRRELGAAAAVASRRFAALRRALLSRPDGALPVSEPEWNDLESAAGRAAELRRALERGDPVRGGEGRLLPAREATWPPLARPPGQADLDAALTHLDRELEAGARVLRERYGYALLTRNCVTELVRLLAEGLGPGEEAMRRALGGVLRPGDGLDFIPFVFFASVQGALPVARVERLPSFRERELARERAHGNDLAVTLREGNTLSSRIYRRRSEDGSFLFFTTGARALRPLAGLANLVFGLGSSAVGVVTAPFDGGRRLEAGARGMLFSLPELAFSNVRKGSFDAWGLRARRASARASGRATRWERPRTSAAASQ